MELPRIYFFIPLALLVFVQSGCFFHGGVSTFNFQTQDNGSGFLSAIERNGQWDTDGPPPKAGDITERPLYRKLERAATYSTQGTSREYEVSELLPPGRYLITSIREIGSTVDGKNTIHYYEVQFEHGTGGVH